MNEIERGYAIAAEATRIVRVMAKEQHVSITALAQSIGMPYSTMRRRMKRHGWHYGEFAEIGRVLGFAVPDVWRAATETIDGVSTVIYDGHVNPSAREIAQYVLDHDVSIHQAAQALDYRPVGALMT